MELYEDKFIDCIFEENKNKIIRSHFISACTTKQENMLGFGMDLDINPFDKKFENEGKCDWLFDP